MNTNQNHGHGPKRYELYDENEDISEIHSFDCSRDLKKRASKLRPFIWTRSEI